MSNKACLKSAIQSQS